MKPGSYHRDADLISLECNLVIKIFKKLPGSFKCVAEFEKTNPRESQAWRGNGTIFIEGR